MQKAFQPVNVRRIGRVGILSPDTAAAAIEACIIEHEFTIRRRKTGVYERVGQREPGAGRAFAETEGEGIASVPAASFFDIILEAIKGILRTVAVTSRSAYIFLSAGTRLLDCPIVCVFLLKHYHIQAFKQ